MSKDLADNMKWRLLMEGLCRQRMPQRMQAVALWGPEMDASKFLPIVDDAMKVISVGEGLKRWCQCEEHFAAI